MGAVLPCAEALKVDALAAEAGDDRAEIWGDIFDELAVGGQMENLAVENEVVPDLGAEQDPRTLHRRSARHHRIKTAGILKRPGRSAHIFECGFRHDPPLVHLPVVPELGHRALDMPIIRRPAYPSPPA